MYTDGVSMGHIARSERRRIAGELQGLSDKELQGIEDPSRFSGFRKVLSYFDRTNLRERIVAGDILSFRQEGREGGCSEREISNVYGILLSAGEIY